MLTLLFGSGFPIRKATFLKLKLYTVKQQTHLYIIRRKKCQKLHLFLRKSAINYIFLDEWRWHC